MESHWILQVLMGFLFKDTHSTFQFFIGVSESIFETFAASTFDILTG